ncbi:MAG: aldo/keto reductase [Candidatus Glassbacteria bacterium]|nr:aldo/keto reductase [Candidatus Glassbacteria bacterium]
MQYLEYGNTGLNVSRLAFGGMRFEEPRNTQRMAEIVIAAREAGINYFDTAPGYCADQSEIIMGAAVSQMRGMPGEFYLSSKTSKSDPEGVRSDLGCSLERLKTDRIDFYHCWYLLTLDGWEARKAGGAVDELLKAREEGLVRHLVISTHLAGDEIGTVIDEDIFEGVTLGYNASNFAYRRAGIEAAGRAGIGVVVMNPLGGGVITDNPDTFGYIRSRPEESILEAALNFLWAHDEITAALVGFRNTDDVATAAAAWKKFDGAVQPDLARMERQADESFNALCTGCRYCRDCPEGIPVYKYMEAYNHMMLKGGEGLHDRLKWHFGIHDLKELELCTKCGNCEQACTQHLPILQRFEEMKEVYANPA